MLEVHAELVVSEGRVVRRRLAPDAPARVVSDDPAGLARTYADGGASGLLLTDLDGAAADAPRALELARRLSAETGLPLAYRGGLRSAADIDAAGEAGVTQVVLDSVAFGDAA